MFAICLLLEHSKKEKNEEYAISLCKLNFVLFSVFTTKFIHRVSKRDWVEERNFPFCMENTRFASFVIFSLRKKSINSWVGYYFFAKKFFNFTWDVMATCSSITSCWWSLLGIGLKFEILEFGRDDPLSLTAWKFVCGKNDSACSLKSNCRRFMSLR